MSEVKALSGVLPIDKAPGMTSHDAVALVRRALRPKYGKVKVGHAGTLDPDATGVLLICVGSATRLADLLAERGKTYHAGFMLGATTTTEDASGEIVSKTDASQITRAQVEQALASLTGSIQQVPPMVSAVHHEGKRLYELARQGIEVERAARTIQVDRIELQSFGGGQPPPAGEIVVECGKGTYVRTICADLGERLGVGGHMTKLRRLRVGVFSVDSALPVEQISLESIADRIVSASESTNFLPLRIVTTPEAEDVLHGRSIATGAVVSEALGAHWVRLVDGEGELIALAEPDETGQRLLPKKVLVVSS